MKNPLIIIFLFCSICITTVKSTNSPKLLIVPKPKEIYFSGNYNKINNVVNVYFESKSKLDSEYIATVFNELGLKTIFSSKKSANLLFTIDPKISSNSEAYEITVSDKNRNQIIVKAPSKRGLIYALQSIRQIIDKNSLTIPICRIYDEPAFPWRAYMQDESRHFQGMETVKKIMDEMVRLKMNTFHWHLVDDQGWRIEIKKYPKLTSVGSKRDLTEGDFSPSEWDAKYPNRKMFYTQKEIKEIIKYADARGITIIPEIEMPGHSSAATYSYPWLGASSSIKGSGVYFDLYDVTNPKVELFLQDVLTEVMKLFPSKIVHIGGDEANYMHWQSNPEIVSFMKKNDIPTYLDLQIWSINRISKFINSKGFRMIGWNEITGDNIRNEAHIEASQNERLAPGTIVQFWDGDLSLINKSIEKGYDVVNSNRHFTYLDYPYDVISFEHAYSFNPIPKGLQEEKSSKILGTGCQMWGESTPNADRLYYQVFPRLAAYAECGWTPFEEKDFEDFNKRFSGIKAIWIEKGYLKSQIEHLKTIQRNK